MYLMSQLNPKMYPRNSLPTVGLEHLMHTTHIDADGDLHTSTSRRIIPENHRRVGPYAAVVTTRKSEPIPVSIDSRLEGGDDERVAMLLRLTADPLPIVTSDGLVEWQNEPNPYLETSS